MQDRQQAVVQSEELLQLLEVILRFVDRWESLVNELAVVVLKAPSDTLRFRE